MALWDDIRELLGDALGACGDPETGRLGMMLERRRVSIERGDAHGVEWVEVLVDVGDMAQLDVTVALADKPVLGGLVVEEGVVRLRHQVPMALLRLSEVLHVMAGMTQEAARSAARASVGSRAAALFAAYSF